MHLTSHLLAFRLPLNDRCASAHEREALLIDDLDKFWFEILSEDPDRIEKAWQCLSDDEQYALISHLQRMSADPGWQESQRLRARKAFAVLEKYIESEDRRPPEEA
jgi:hypothetical protein